MALGATPRRFAILYVLAMFGAFIAFMPLGALVLPAKIAQIDAIDGSAAQVQALSWLLAAGGVMAAVGNIGAGYLSDMLYRRHGDRRRMVLIGLTAVVAALGALAAAQDFAELMLAVLAFQLALNGLLSPLFALMVDHIPDAAKGRMAGWLGLALPVGSLSVAGLAALPSIGPLGQLGAMAVATVVLVAPLALFWSAPARIEPSVAPLTSDTARDRTGLAGNFALAWIARLLVQFAAAAILPYLYYYVAYVARPGASATAISAAVGMLSLAFTIASVLGGLLVGWLSDHARHRQVVLSGSAVLVAISMAMLAVMSLWPLVVMAYALFAIGLAGFLAVDSALVAQLISASARRATLLGVMNLTNTLPGILAPLVTLAVIGDGGGDASRMIIVLQLSAVGALVAAGCAGLIRVPISKWPG